MIDDRKKVLNYREFLSKIVKFRQVIEFNPSKKKKESNSKATANQ